MSQWAARLKVSRIALALRLEHVGVAPSGFHTRFKTKQKKEVARKTSGNNWVDHTVVRLSEMGGNFTRSVIEALDRQVIDQVQAVEALGVGEQNFEKARTAVRRHLELARGG
jgi:Zn-dependent peptidase ImmA (M78 family)